MNGPYIFLICWILIIALNAIFQMYYKEKIIAWLLFLANSQPWNNFYPLKNKLLKQYAKLIGYEYQHFDPLGCYKCYGTGFFGYEQCWDCDGSGIYKPEMWVGLAKYQFGKYIFHTPIGRIVGEIDPKPPPSLRIDGKIIHTYQRYSNEANLILKIIYDTNAYPSKPIGTTYYYSKKINLSLYNRLNNILFTLKYPYKVPNKLFSRFYHWLHCKLVDLGLKDGLPF